MPVQREHSIFGVFKGIGDLLWAAPVIRSELDRGLAVHLLLFPNPSLVSLCSLIGFGPNALHLHLHSVPASLPGLLRFVRDTRHLTPQYIWISPHASLADSSYKVPLILHLLSTLCWSSAPLVGASSERLSRLFDLRLPVDRSLPLSQREWSAYRLFRELQSSERPELPAIAPHPHFLPPIVEQFPSAPVYDLVIHPGASATNRIWPYRKYVALLNALPAGWKIAIEGLPAELEPLQALLKQAGINNLTWSSGTLREALQTLTGTRRVLTMDTAFMHFAAVLGIPGIALFGAHHPSNVIGEGSIQPVYQVTAPCQPCGRSTCRQPALYCLDNLDPLAVAERLTQLVVTARG